MQNKSIFFARYLRQLGLSLITFLIFVFPVWPASVSQRTEGSCSPAVADVKGNVSIVCEGVDPAFLNEIVKLLNEILRDTKKLEQIKQDLDKASKRTDQIEDKLADRRLSDAQVMGLAHTLEEFAGQEYEVTTFWEMKEPLAIANRIHRALTLGGWKYIKPKSAAFLLGVAGVLVYVHPAADKRTKKAADSVVSALTKEGIYSEQRNQNDPDNPNNKLYINVGTKP